MPWHDVQYLKITCRVGPFGGVTCGRVGRPPICADTAAENAAIATIITATGSKARTARLRGSGAGFWGPASDRAGVWGGAPRGVDRATTSHHFERLKPAGARADLVLIDPVQVKDAQQHVRRPLRVVREHEVAVPLERAVDAADENHGHLLVSMTVRVAHVAALVDQHVV